MDPQHLKVLVCARYLIDARDLLLRLNSLFFFLITPIDRNAFATARGYSKIHFETPQAIREAENRPQPVYVRRCRSYVIHDAVQCVLNSCAPGATAAVAASLVPLHVAPHAERFTTSFVGAQKWLLASVRVAVDP